MDINEQAKILVWMKGSEIYNYSSLLWRTDRYGSVIKFTEYGNRDSQYGWEIDHILPVSKGGTSQIANLQPLNWVNNLKKSNNTTGY